MLLARDFVRWRACLVFPRAGCATRDALPLPTRSLRPTVGRVLLIAVVLLLVCLVEWHVETFCGRCAPQRLALLPGVDGASARRRRGGDEPRIRRYTADAKLASRERVLRMFHHAYNGYMSHAFPSDELKPLSCTAAADTFGCALTLVDGLDMLALTGEYEEFIRQVHYVSTSLNFSSGSPVSVFEFSIRVLGSLVAAHLLALDVMRRVDATVAAETAASGHGTTCRMEFGSLCPSATDAIPPYSGGLLRKAEELAKKLLPAFNTQTGIPLNELSFKNGVDWSRGCTTCPAAAGSLLLEFGALTALTGNCTYMTVARRALEGIWKHRSTSHLVGTMINVTSGAWNDPFASIGASIDSYYEYMVKSYIVFGDLSFHEMWKVSYGSVLRHLYQDGWYVRRHMDGAALNCTGYRGSDLLHQIACESVGRYESLLTFWPGLQVLAGDVVGALDSYAKMLCVFRDYQGLPEVVSVPQYQEKDFFTATRQGPGYPLRPEFMESTLLLYSATKDPHFLQVGEEMLNHLERLRTKCGFAAVRDVVPLELEDKMDSFFISETLKYLYLLFTPSREELLVAGLSHVREPLFSLENFVFNTEAHPLPLTREFHQAVEQCREHHRDFALELNDPHKIRVDYQRFPASQYEPACGAEGSLTMAPPCNWHQVLAPKCPALHYFRDIGPHIERIFYTHTVTPDWCYTPGSSARARGTKVKSAKDALLRRGNQ